MILLLSLLLAGVPAETAVQAARQGTLRVVVFDPSGAVIPGALVKVSGAEDRTRSVVKVDVPTDEQAAALVGELTPGRYDIEVAFAGFETTVARNVRVRAGDGNRRQITTAIEMVNLLARVGSGTVADDAPGR